MKTPHRRGVSRHYSITPVAPKHFRDGQVVVEERQRTSLPWKLSVGRYLALGSTLNEATIELFAKVVTCDPLA
jgi:hypothetical protein